MDGPDKVTVRKAGSDPTRAITPARVARSDSGDRTRVRAVLSGSSVQRAVPVGPPGDAYEREADVVAERVMRAEAATPATRDEDDERKKLTSSPEVRALRRQVAAPSDAGADSGGAIPEPDEAELEALRNVRRKPADSLVDNVESPELYARITSPSGGRPLAPDVRRRVESAVPYDFSNVVVHDDDRDRMDARALGARAFTYGSHIWLGPGERSGDVRLMAHELTHVVQQGGAVALAPQPVRRARYEPYTVGRGPPLPRAPPRQSIHPTLTAGPRVQGESDGFSSFLQPVADFAASLPGFNLLSVFLGRNPITKKPVERNLATIARGLLDFVPNGDEIYKNLIVSGALQRAIDWVQLEWAKVGLTWQKIVDLFALAWNSLVLSDLWYFDRASGKIEAIFGPPLASLWRFVKVVGRKILDFIIEALLSGKFAQDVLALIRKVGETFTLIAGDPVGFVHNLVRAVKGGFEKFSSRIQEHLKNALARWLLGTLGSAGLKLPKELDAKGMFSLALQILGITYENVRTALVKRLGPERVQDLEDSFDVIKDVVRDGPIAAWNHVVKALDSFREQALEAIQGWIETAIVKKATLALAMLFVPGGAVIQAIMRIYDTIVFFMENANQIMMLAQAVFDSLADIAHGRLTTAIDSVENAMVLGLTLAISFLARFAGLTKLPAEIKRIIRELQKPVHEVIERIVDWIVKQAKGFVAKAKAAAGAVLEWWRVRFAFRAGGEQHSLEFQGEGADATLVLASKPEEVGTWLERNKPDASAGELAELYGLAHARYTKVVGQLKKARKEGPDAPAAQKELPVELAALKDELAALMDALRGSTKFEETKLTYGEDLVAGDLGRSAEANPLTVRGEKGTPPSVESGVWQIVRERQLGRGTYYVRGHLMNEQLHGPGNKPGNLTPIAQSTNKKHEKLAESKVKDKVWNRKDSNPDAKPVKYTVVAVYDATNKPKLDPLKKQIKAAVHEVDGKRQMVPLEVRMRMLKIVEAEQGLASSLVCRAVELIPTGAGGFTEGPAFVNEKIDNRIPDTIPALEGVAPVGA